MKKAFSLFELLVSISIIGILVALVSISYSSAQKKARDARRVQDLSNIQKAAEQYYSFYLRYPDSNTGKWTFGSSQWVDTSGIIILGILPTGPKGDDYRARSNPNGGASTLINDGGGYCLCTETAGGLTSLESSAGNSGMNCDYTNAVKNYYCVSNQQ